MRLRIQSGGKSWEFLSREDTAYITVGRREGNDIVLPDDPAVSSMHLRIERFLQEWSFTDQMSDTGTLHNGNNSYNGELKDGDELKLGDSVIRIINLAESAPPAQRTVAPAPQPMRAAPTRQPQPQPIQHQPEYSSPPSMDYPIPARQPSKPPAAAPGPRFAVFAALAIMAVGIIVAASVFSEMAPEEQPVMHREQPLESVVAEPPPRDLSRDYRDTIRELRNESTGPLHERLAAIQQVSEKAEELNDSSLTALARAATTYLKSQLSRELSQRYSIDHAEISRLRNAFQFAEAARKLADFAQLLETSPYHSEWAERSRVYKFIEDETARIATENERWTGEHFSLADKALYHNAFGDAAVILQAVQALALLDEATRNGIALEAEAHDREMHRQSSGERPPPREPFDVEKDRLPPATRSKILPQGESSSLRNEMRLRQRLTRFAADSAFAGADARHWSWPARLEKLEHGNATLRVSRALPGLDDFSYRVTQPLTVLPALTRVSLYEQIPELSQNERVGILMLCFDHGLMDEAARVACELWKAHPDTKEAIDALLATKLRIDVPEGGFIERDGRLVLPG